MKKSYERTHKLLILNGPSYTFRIIIILTSYILAWGCFINLPGKNRNLLGHLIPEYVGTSNNIMVLNFVILLYKLLIKYVSKENIFQEKWGNVDFCLFEGPGPDMSKNSPKS